MAFDPSRLYSALMNTGLQQTNNPLYQVINQLIGLVAGINTQAAETAAGNIVIGGFLPGSVIFADPSGNLAGDNTKFLWDILNSRLVTAILVGGSIPTSPLTFQTTTANGIAGNDFVWKNGNNGASEAMRLFFRIADSLSVLKINNPTFSGNNVGLVIRGIGANAVLFESGGASINTFYAPTGFDLWQFGAGQILPNDFGAGNATRGTTPLLISGGANGGQTLLDSAAGCQLQLKGRSSSFPGLKRSGIIIQVRLADDSGDAPLSASEISLPSGTAAPTAGQTTLVAGTVTVNTTAMTATALLFLQRKTAGGTIGDLTYTQVNGTSFTINSANALDTSVVNWWIVETH